MAIGRALIASPTLILMDEPLASLDDARKAEILPYVERLRDEGGIPIVYVSHSIAEVSRLATDVVVLAGGRVVASGGAAEVLAERDLLPPEDRDEAGALVELTLVGRGRVRAERARLRGRRVAGAAGGGGGRGAGAGAGAGARRDAGAGAAGGDQRAQRAWRGWSSRWRRARGRTRW